METDHDKSQEDRDSPHHSQSSRQEEDEAPARAVNDQDVRLSENTRGDRPERHGIISTFSRQGDVGTCVRSIEAWVQECHGENEISDLIFPVNITIRGTSLLDDLDHLAQIFYEEYTGQSSFRYVVDDNDDDENGDDDDENGGDDDDDDDDDDDEKDASEAIVCRVASIPGFVKCVILIDLETERTQVMQHRFMKRVLLHRAAILQVETEEHSSSLQPHTSGASPNHSRGVILESWLLTLLDSSGIAKTRAVDYLEYVSNLQLEDYLAATISKKPTTIHRRGGTSATELQNKFNNARKLMFDQIARFRHLEALLITLDNEDEERAAVTAAVQWSLQKSLRRPFVLFMNFCDFLFHLSLLGIWRIWLLQDVRTRKGQQEDLYYSLGLYVACASIGYFCYRWISDFVSLARIKFRLARNYVLSLQSLLQLLVIGLVVFTTAGSGVATFNAVNWSITNETYNTVASISLGVLWLKVILFLQVVNAKVAAYVLALVQILVNDIFFFMIIVFATVVGFGDMLYNLYATDIDFCTPFTVLFDGITSTDIYLIVGELIHVIDIPEPVGMKYNATHFLLSTNSSNLTERISANETTTASFFLNPSDFSQQNLLSTNPFCQSRRESYFAIYRIYLANFSFDEFRKTALTTSLFVAITFLALIVLLNLLIAIIQLSYTLSVQKSERLFGRARLTFVSQVLALEDLLHPNIAGEKKRHQGGELISHHVLRMLSVAQLVLTATVWGFLSYYAALYMIPLEMVGLRALICALLTVCGAVPILIVSLRLVVGWDTHGMRADRALQVLEQSTPIHYLYHLPLRFFSTMTLGLSFSESEAQKMLLESTTLESGKTPEEKQLDMIIHNLEDRVDTIQTKLEDKVDMSLSKMEDRLLACLG